MNSTVIEHVPAHTRGVADQKPTILLVGAVEDPGGEWPFFRQFPWRIEHAGGIREALNLIGRDAHHVIVSEKDLPDGNWKDVLEAAAVRRNAPVLIVTSRLADEHLWAEVLNLGGYDVLAQPLDRDEVRRTVSLAWQHWRNRHGMETETPARGRRTARKEST